MVLYTSPTNHVTKSVDCTHQADRLKRDDQLAAIALPLGNYVSSCNPLRQQQEVCVPLAHPKNGFALVPEATVSLGLTLVST